MVTSLQPGCHTSVCVPQVSVVRYHFHENCTEAKYAAVLAAFNAWQPWKLSKEHALAEVQCGYDNLRVQVRAR
jgi:hypothetical protein